MSITTMGVMNEVIDGSQAMSHPPIGTPRATGHTGNSTPAEILLVGFLKQVNYVDVVNLVNSPKVVN